MPARLYCLHSGCPGPAPGDVQGGQHSCGSERSGRAGLAPALLPLRRGPRGRGSRGAGRVTVAALPPAPTPPCPSDGPGLRGHVTSSRDGRSGPRHDHAAEGAGGQWLQRSGRGSPGFFLVRHAGSRAPAAWVTDAPLSGSGSRGTLFPARRGVGDLAVVGRGALQAASLPAPDRPALADDVGEGAGAGPGRVHHRPHAALRLQLPRAAGECGGGAAAPPPPPAPWASLPPGTPASVPRGLAGSLPWGPTGRVLLVWSGRGGGPPRADGRWRWRGWWPGWGEAASGTTRG